MPSAMRSMTVQIRFTISNRRSTVIASEPLDTERVNWTAVGENCMLIARRDSAVDVVKFSP